MILASHFQLALFEMERRSVSPRAGQERVQRDHLEGVKYHRNGEGWPRLREVTPRIYEFTRTGERASERAQRFLLT